ncbi:MAG: hypothetical protein FWH48_01275 [Oscillospiraceae bacterium]|nr:hypothetical protein [Oscillospiraceae bacterium]
MQGKRRIFTVVLALFMVIALTFSASAAWPSFQNENTNNGIIATQPPITSPALVTGAPIQLPTDNTNYDVFTGIDAASVIGNGYVYTVYNGGDWPATNPNGGGARVQATNLTTGAVLYNEELFDLKATNPVDVHANNVSQLSTPFYLPYSGSTSGALYALKSYTINEYASDGFSGWSYGNGTSVTGGMATFPANQTTNISSTITLNDSVHTLSIQTDLNPGSNTTAVYTVQLENVSTGAVVATLVPSISFTDNGGYASYTIYTYNGSLIPAGTYKLRIIVSASSTSAATGTQISLDSYWWAFYSVSSTGSACKITRITMGEGQANTPISYDKIAASSGKDSSDRGISPTISNYRLYWGIWGGTRSYYQYGTIADGGPMVTPTINVFTPNSGAGDDFYGAGAYSDGTNVYFGSDSGTIYKQSASAFSSAGTTYSISGSFPNDQIRSSMAYKDNYLYFTSAYTNSSANIYNGELWRMNISSGTLTYVDLNAASTSTPVISDNNYVYVGTYIGFASGTVKTILASNIGVSGMLTVYTGDPVQASPIVYTAAPWNYVYFTTNSGTGAGYCYRHNPTSGVVQAIWTAGGTSSNPYAVQGFASDNGYLVYGDDGNYLYIMH